MAISFKTINIIKYSKISQTKFMGFYNYHAVATNLIKNGHCNKAIFKQKHNVISPALVLYFDNHKPMPIRQDSFEKYLILLKTYDITIVDELSYG